MQAQRYAMRILESETDKRMLRLRFDKLIEDFLVVFEEELEV